MMEGLGPWTSQSFRTAFDRSITLMNSLPCLTFAVAGLAVCGSVLEARDPEQVAWQSLFDGKSLDGWEQHSGDAKYTVEDGAIVGTSVAKTGNTFLCTTRTYGDFIFECEWKVDPELNSGIQFRSRYFDEPTEVPAGDGKTKTIPADRVHGYQSEIDVDPAKNRMWSVGVYDEARRGWLYPGIRGGDGAAFTEQGRKITNVDDWNTVRIECVGSSIKTYLNGELRTDFEDDLTPEGIIALQVHGVGNDADKIGKQVRWRNIRLKDLSGK